MSRKSLVKSTGVIGIATALSRVLGFVRDMVIANFFGTGLGAQAFVVAFRIPNSLRDLVGEGAMNAAIVPVLTEYRARDNGKEFLSAARVLLNISFLALSVLTITGILFSPFIVRIIAPGFIEDAGKFALTVKLNRMIFPYLLLIGLTAYSMGVLNAMRHFASPAFGPILMNIAMIASAFWLCPKFGVTGLVIGVLAGGVLQLALNVPFLYSNGIKLDIKEGFRHAAAKKIGILMIPRAMGSAVYQINIFVDTILASLASIVGEGGVAALYYANRLIQFPLAIFAIALAQAALPKMSHEFAVKDMDGFKGTLSFSLRAIFFVMIPSSFGLASLGKPIIKLLFERGEFTVYSSAITESALFFYAFGLAAYGGIKLLVSSFYSMHDTMTPVKTALAAVIINAILSVILMFPMRLGGLALATSISATFNFIALYILLRRKIGDMGTSAILGSIARALASSAVMTIALRIAAEIIPPKSFAGLFIDIAVGALAFLAAAIVFKAKEIMELLAWITKKR